ncbi:MULTISPECIES: DUF3060 domain-containing protein [Actinomyces]|uniref:DUF3060 domain-containing protein n=1 Tax=Actinomyces TaxID=1654 RepID=UPI00109DCC58|nr:MULTISPECIES: DUF3060 domain-containing protein [Actinomyces]
MRIPNKLLVPATVLALGASLAACSISVGGSDGESAPSQETTAVVATEEATQETDDADDVDSGDTATDEAEGADADKADADGTAAAGASGSGTDGITNPDWLGVISGGIQESVSGDYGIQSSGGTYNLVGELDSLAIQGSEVTVSAQSVGTLTVQGSDVTVYVREVDDVVAFGSNVKVYYLEGDPTVQDIGANNTVEKLSD